jgi:hypothetical protein
MKEKTSKPVLQKTKSKPSYQPSFRERTYEELIDEINMVYAHFIKDDFAIQTEIMIKFSALYKNQAIYTPITANEMFELDNIVISRAAELSFGSQKHAYWVSADGVIFIEPYYDKRPMEFISFALTPSVYKNTADKNIFNGTIDVITEVSSLKEDKKNMLQTKKVHEVARVNSKRQLFIDKESLLYEGFQFKTRGMLYLERGVTDNRFMEEISKRLDLAQQTAKLSDPLYRITKNASEYINRLIFYSNDHRFIRYQ